MVRLTMAQKRRRALDIDDLLQRRFPDARCELNFSSPLELLAATVLSAQCTDVRVNQITPSLFARYPTAQAYAEADRSELEELIRPTGFFRNKANSLIGIGQALVTRFDGQIPRNLADLVTLPGVGRKTANVVLGNVFGVPGITVDTHVGRISRRLQWSPSNDPVKVEADLAALFPPERWTDMCHRVIFLGRRICFARVPACAACPVAHLCPANGDGEQDAAKAAAMVARAEKRFAA